MLVKEFLIIGDIVFLHPEEIVFLTLHHLVHVVGNKTELIGRDKRLILVLRSVESIFSTECEMLKEISAYVEVTVDLLTKEGIVGHKSESDRVPSRSTVHGVRTSPVAFEVTHGD